MHRETKASPNAMLKRTKKAPLARARRAKKPRLHAPRFRFRIGGTRSVALVGSLQPILSLARVPLRCRSRLARVAYDSDNGNLPFGIGWTDKGLPQDRDAEESDVFIFSGAEAISLMSTNAIAGVRQTAIVQVASVESSRTDL